MVPHTGEHKYVTKNPTLSAFSRELWQNSQFCWVVVNHFEPLICKFMLIQRSNSINIAFILFLTLKNIDIQQKSHFKCFLLQNYSNFSGFARSWMAILDHIMLIYANSRVQFNQYCFYMISHTEKH